MGVANLVHRAKYIVENEGVIPFFNKSIDFLNNRADKTVGARINAFRHQLKYSKSAPDPYELIRVDPSEIDHLVTPHFWSEVSTYTTHIIGGDWDEVDSDRTLTYTAEYEDYNDRAVIPFNRFEFFESARMHFRENVPWEETSIYEFLVEHADPGLKQRYRSEASVRRALDELDQLYDHVKNNGYKSQSVLRDTHGAPFEKTGTETPMRPSVPPEHDEVMVAIGRDGEIYFDDGRHRFTVGKLLSVEDIPVRVLVRHEEWQELRNEIATANDRREISDRAQRHLDHPDMGDIRTEPMLK